MGKSGVGALALPVLVLGTFAAFYLFLGRAFLPASIANLLGGASKDAATKPVLDSLDISEVVRENDAKEAAKARKKLAEAAGVRADDGVVPRHAKLKKERGHEARILDARGVSTVELERDVEEKADIEESDSDGSSPQDSDDSSGDAAARSGAKKSKRSDADLNQVALKSLNEKLKKKQITAEEYISEKAVLERAAYGEPSLDNVHEYLADVLEHEDGETKDAKTKGPNRDLQARPPRLDDPSVQQTFASPMDATTRQADDHDQVASGVLDTREIVLGQNQEEYRVNVSPEEFENNVFMLKHAVELGDYEDAISWAEVTLKQKPSCAYCKLYRGWSYVSFEAFRCSFSGTEASGRTRPKEFAVCASEIQW